MSELSPVFDTEEINQRLAANRKRLREREQSDLTKVLSTAEGRRFVWWLLGVTTYFEDGFSSSGVEMGRNQGKRKIGELVFKRITPDLFHQMQQEAQTDKFIREAEQAEAEKENQNG